MEREAVFRFLPAAFLRLLTAEEAAKPVPGQLPPFFCVLLGGGSDLC